MMDIKRTCILLFGAAMLLTGVRDALWYYSQATQLAQYAVAAASKGAFTEKLVWAFFTAAFGAASLVLGFRLKKERMLYAFFLLWGVYSLLYAGYKVASAAYPMFRLKPIVLAEPLILVALGLLLIKLGRDYLAEEKLDLRLAGACAGVYALHLSVSPLVSILRLKASISAMSAAPLILFLALLISGLLLWSGRVKRVSYTLYLLAALALWKALIWIPGVLKIASTAGTAYFYPTLLSLPIAFAYIALGYCLARLGRL